MSYPFGQDIAYWFYPLSDDRSPESLLTAQTPAIYLFDNQPSRDTAALGTDALSTITSWTWNAGKKGFSFTIPAIDDPNPSSLSGSWTYWLAINFRLQSGGQVQTILKALELERVSGQSRTVSVTDDDLKVYYPAIGSCSTLDQRKAYIAQAVEDVKAKLLSRGYQWARIHRADRLGQVVAFRALAMIMLAQSQETNDKFAAKYLEYKTMFQDALDSLKLEYDSDNDGQPDTQVQQSSTLFIIR